MTKICKWVFFLTLYCFFHFSCTKTDLIKKSEHVEETSQGVDISNSENSTFQKLVEFLAKKQEESNPVVAEKIAHLLENMSDSYLTKIQLTETIGVIVCDLDDYTNETLPGYEHTYYKMYFEENNGTITGGLIHTVHTNMEKSEVDDDFENIFLQKSKSFSGTIVVNQLSDEFVQQLEFENGGLVKSFGLSGTDENGTSASSGTCTAYYLTIRHWVNGVVVDETTELLFVECDGCGGGPLGQPTSLVTNYNDCGGGGGGGGNGNGVTEPPITIESEVDLETPPEAEGANCKPIVRGRTYKQIVGGRTVNVYADPAICYNPIIDCIYYGKSVKRVATVGFHTPRITPLPTSWMVGWVAPVYQVYTAYDGSWVKTRTSWYEKVEIIA